MIDSKLFNELLYHEIGHLLYYLKAIRKDTWTERITRNYNLIVEIVIDSYLCAFRVESRYYIPKLEDKKLLYLGGAIMDTLNKQSLAGSEHDFMCASKLGFTNDNLFKTIELEIENFSSKDMDFIDDMFLTFNVGKSPITLEEMNPIICKHFPEFTNCMYKKLK